MFNPKVICINVDAKLFPKSENGMILINQLEKEILDIKPVAILLIDLPISISFGEWKTLFERIAPQFKPYFRETNIMNEKEKYLYGSVILVLKQYNADSICLEGEENRSFTSKNNCTVIGVKVWLTEKSSPFLIFAVYLRPTSTYENGRTTIEWIQKAIAEQENAKILIMGDFNATSLEWSKPNIFGIVNQHLAKKYKIRDDRGLMITRFIRVNKLVCLNRVELGPTNLISAKEKQPACEVGSSNKDPIEGDMNKRVLGASYVDVAMVCGHGHKIWNSIDLREIEGFNHRLLIAKKMDISQEKVIIYDTNRISEKDFSEFNKLYQRKVLEGWKSWSIPSIVEIMNQQVTMLYTQLHHIQTKIALDKQRNNKRYRGAETQRIRRLKQHIKVAEEKKKQLVKRLKYAKINDKNQLKMQKHKIAVRLNNLKKALLHSINLDAKLSVASNITSTNAGFDSKEELIQKWKNLFPHVPRHEAQRLSQLRSKIKPLEIDKSEIEAAIDEIKSSKFTSYDGLYSKVFFCSYPFLKRLITNICQMSFFTGTLPKNCRTVLANLIPKKKPNEFRKIIVTNPLSSLLEKIAAKRFEKLLEEKKLLNPYQFSSSEDLVVRFLTLAGKFSLCSNHHIRVSTLISLDISGAFDHVRHDTLAKKLFDYIGDNNPIVYWLLDFLLSREVLIRQQDMITPKRKICDGIAQGSSLSSLLWNFYIHDVSKDIIIPKKLEVLTYADDFYIVYNGGYSQPTIVKDRDCLQAVLNKLVTKLGELNLNINTEKSEWMYSASNTTYYVKQVCYEFKIKGEVIRKVDNMCILGAMVTSKLEMDVKAYQEKCKERLGKSLKKLYSLREFEHSPTKWQSLIKTEIINTILYSNQPMLCFSEKGHKTFNDLIRKSLILIFQWPEGTSNKLIHLLANIPSLDLILSKWLQDHINRPGYQKEGYEYLHGRLIAIQNLKERRILSRSPLSKIRNPNSLIEEVKLVSCKQQLYSKTTLPLAKEDNRLAKNYFPTTQANLALAKAQERLAAAHRELLRYYQREYEQKLKKEMLENHTNITKAICPSIKTWQSIPLNHISKLDILLLQGLYRSGNEWKSIDEELLKRIQALPKRNFFFKKHLASIHRMLCPSEEEEEEDSDTSL